MAATKGDMPFHFPCVQRLSSLIAATGSSSGLNSYFSALINMIDKLQRIAQSIQILRLPSVLIGLTSLAAIVGIIFFSKSQHANQFVIPSFVSLLWAMSTYSFIVTFRSIPEKASKTSRFFSRLKRNINRGWYWFIGVVFLGTTVAAILVTYRMIVIWLRDYGG